MVAVDAEPPFTTTPVPAAAPLTADAASGGASGRAILALVVAVGAGRDPRSPAGVTGRRRVDTLMPTRHVREVADQSSGANDGKAAQSGPTLIIGGDRGLCGRDPPRSRSLAVRWKTLPAAGARPA